VARGEITGRKPRQSAVAPARTPPIRGPPTHLFTIKSFCVAHGISEGFYFKLREQGLGPDEMRLGARVLITHESAARWRIAREAETAAATTAATAWPNNEKAGPEGPAQQVKEFKHRGAYRGHQENPDAAKI
jgi:hypothetical protein